MMSSTKPLNFTPMKVIVVGATGATGIHLVQHLLDQGHFVKAFVRSPEKLNRFKDHPKLEIVVANTLDLSDDELKGHASDCDAIASCLGHSQTFKGMFGFPRRLVTDTVAKWTGAILANERVNPVKFVLMNTVGNQNRDLNEPISFAHKMVIGLLRLMLPPHVDNEQAADFLRTEIGQGNEFVEWAAVRPDSLTDDDQVTDYDVYESPIRSAIFDSGETSRINVGNFMSRLISEDALWDQWRGKMPVIYNSAQES